MKILEWFFKHRGFWKTWKLSEHKYFEVQADWRSSNREWFSLNIETRTDCDHEGAYFGFMFLNLIYFGLTFYDNRHQDPDPDEEPWFDDWQKIYICDNPDILPTERAYYAIYYEGEDIVRIFWGWNKRSKPEGVYYDQEVGKMYKLKYITSEGLSKQSKKPPEGPSNSMGRI